MQAFLSRLIVHQQWFVWEEPPARRVGSLRPDS